MKNTRRELVFMWKGTLVLHIYIDRNYLSVWLIIWRIAIKLRIIITSDVSVLRERTKDTAHTHTPNAHREYNFRIRCL